MPASDYVTLAQVKAYMPTNEVAVTTTWDGVVTTLCTNLSRAFDTLTFRKPGAYAVSTDTEQRFDGIPLTATDYTQYLFIDELAAAPTSVIVAGTAYGSTDYNPWPYNALLDGIPYVRLDLDPDGQYKTWGSKPRSIAVTGKFGWSTSVPADVYEAMLLYIVRMVKKAQQNYLEVGTLLDSGQVMIGAKRDEDLAALIAIYKKGNMGKYGT